jgi:hypothetical protein
MEIVIYFLTTDTDVFCKHVYKYTHPFCPAKSATTMKKYVGKDFNIRIKYAGCWTVGRKKQETFEL